MSLLEWSFPDDLTRHVAALLLEHSHHEDLEVEGKLGRILHIATKQRYSAPGNFASQSMFFDPTNTSTSNNDHQFEASLPHPVFVHLTDRILKHRVENEMHLAHVGDRAARLAYKHPIIVDHFYSNGDDSSPIRVSHGRDGRVTECVSKKKLSHIDCLMPSVGPLLPIITVTNSHPAPSLPPIDFRITLAREVQQPPPPPSSQPFMIRKKDRRCYELVNEMRVDCTIVETWTTVARSLDGQSYVGAGKSRITYEVELEMAKDLVSIVRHESDKHRRSRENELVHIAKSFVENCRSMARVLVEPSIPLSCRPINKQQPVPRPSQPPPTDNPRKRPRESADDSKESD